MSKQSQVKKKSADGLVRNQGLFSEHGKLSRAVPFVSLAVFVTLQVITDILVTANNNREQRNYLINNGFFGIAEPRDRIATRIFTCGARIVSSSYIVIIFTISIVAMLTMIPLLGIASAIIAFPRPIRTTPTDIIRCTFRHYEESLPHTQVKQTPNPIQEQTTSENNLGTHTIHTLCKLYTKLETVRNDVTIPRNSSLPTQGWGTGSNSKGVIVTLAEDYYFRTIGADAS
mmetsp:Transcript_22943/g.49804  ORF Transcript_22943/g.49804 Transcript_22943/m.49804 type:complete len:230 (+) Transcript_22943:512-1201(+)